MSQTTIDPSVFVGYSRDYKFKLYSVAKNRKKQDSIFHGINLWAIFNRGISKEQNTILSFYCSL
jgi:hypothetical protein